MTERVMKKSKYNETVLLPLPHPHPGERKWLLYNFFTERFLTLSDEEKALFDAFPAAELKGAFRERLEKDGFLTDTDETELLRQRTLKNMRRPESRHVKLTLCPTMDCNFACPYCIETGQKFKGKMSAETVENTVKFAKKLMDAAEAEKLFITWYGGEPLLAMDEIEYLSGRFGALCAARNAKYSAGILTNGYLLDARAMLRLSRCGVNYYRVTVDGPAPVHDKRRVLKGGGPTYDRIMKNLEGLLTDHTIEIRCNVSRSSLGGIEQLARDVEALKERTGNNIILTFAKMLVCRGVPEELRGDMLTESEFADFILTQRDELWLRNDYRSGLPCAACARYDFCIDSRGDICKCSGSLGQKEHRLANVSEFPSEEMLFTHPESRSLREKAFPANPECLQCKLLPRCMGACPLDDGIASAGNCNRYRLHPKELILRLYEAREKEENPV